MRRVVTARFSAGFAAPNAAFLGQEAGASAGGSVPGGSAGSLPRLPLQVPRAPSQPAAGSESRRFANKHSKKALKASLTLGILLGMFFVAWLPFFVTNVTQVSTWGWVLLGFQKLFTLNPAGFNLRHLQVLLGSLWDQRCNFPREQQQGPTLQKGFGGLL